MKVKWILIGILVVILTGCGTKIEIEECDNSLVFIEQSSTQRTDNQVPINLTDASRVLKELAALPTIAEKVIPLKDIEEPQPLEVEVETYQTEYVEGNPKPFTWLNAPGVKGKIIFQLPGCDNFIVPDGSVKYSPNGHEQATYFQGSDNPEGLRMDGRSSIFMAPNCKNGLLTVTYE